MSNIITSVIEVVLATLLVGLAPFVFRFGPNGFLVLLYTMFSFEKKKFLWETFPPDRWNVGDVGQQAIALMMVSLGLVAVVGFFAGNLTRGPRTGMLISMSAPIVATLVLMLRYGYLFEAPQ